LAPRPGFRFSVAGAKDRRHLRWLWAELLLLRLITDAEVSAALRIVVDRPPVAERL